MMGALDVHNPSAGERLGRYVLLEEIGRGSFSVVFRARDEAAGNEVAVKVLAVPGGGAGSWSALERFEPEARIASALRHPAAVRVLSSGRTDDGGVYLVMELVEGLTLAKTLAEGPWEEGATAVLADRVLGCLAEAHGQGIVHRDLKPANIMVARRSAPETARVLDFGAAKLAVARGGLRTRTGTVVGTPHYAAPEQCRGETDLDGRVDLYALGLILAECLTGRRVVAARDPLAASFAQASPWPHALDAAVKQSRLGPVIERAVAKERADRFADAAAMQAALRAVGSPAGAP